MNTCDHYKYVKTKAYTESLKKACLQPCVCESYNLSLDQALKKCIRLLQQLKKDLLLKVSDFHNFSCWIKCIGLVNDNFELWFTSQFQVIFHNTVLQKPVQHIPLLC